MFRSSSPTTARPSLCDALAKEIAKQGRAPQLFVEINTGAEPQKAGILPENADAFLRECRETHGLSIEGLMYCRRISAPSSQMTSALFSANNRYWRS